MNQSSENSQNLNFEGKWKLRNGVIVEVASNSDVKWTPQIIWLGTDINDNVYQFNWFGDHISSLRDFDIVERLSNRTGKMK